MDWQDPVLLYDAHISTRGVGQFKLRARSDDLWHVLPWREREIFSYLSATLQPGDMFIDAGANIGVYTVMASQLVGPTGRVIAVEMMPDTADRLEEHIRLNRLANVIVVRAALSERSGETVVAHVRPGKFGQASIAATHDGADGVSRVEVRTTTLDELASGLDKIVVMKMDLEGAELQALRGANSTMKKVDAIVYESWGRLRTAVNPVDELLNSHGFKLRQLNGNNWAAERA